MFELLDRDGSARIGRFELNGRKMTTPALLPVVNPHKQLITPRDLKERFGFEGLITNALILSRSEEHSERVKEVGVHALLDFDGLIMTDSGTFQAHIYGTEKISNQESVEFQKAIGSDLATPVDVFTEVGTGYEQATTELEETVARAVKALEYAGDMALSGPIQGGTFPELRAKAAQMMAEHPFATFPIGGIVPLMEAYRYADLSRAVLAAQPHLPPDRPVHLFGAGHPVMFGLAALLGADLLDSALYAKYAHKRRLMTAYGSIRLEDLTEIECHCPACCQFSSAKEYAAEPAVETAIASHNLWVSQAELKAVRNAIRTESLWEYVERRAGGHPALEAALRVLHEDAWILDREPRSRSSTFKHTGPLSLSRPALSVALADMPDLPADAPTIATGDVPLFKRRLGARDGVALATAFGPVHPALESRWPFAQSAGASIEESLPREHVEPIEGKEGWRSWAERVLPLMLDHQFGPGSVDILLRGDDRYLRSKHNNRIKAVMAGDETVLTLRTADGGASLGPLGARRLVVGSTSPRHRVIVNADAAPFAEKGRSVFPRFVIAADPAARIGDEVVVVDEDDRPLAVGRLRLLASEIPYFQRGIAVQVRSGLGPKPKAASAT